MKIYTYSTPYGLWKIEHDEPRNRWLSRVKRPHLIASTPVGIYDNPEEAAAAVGSNDTGESEWDRQSRINQDFVLSRWSEGEE